MLDPTSMSPGSIMPSYPWLFEDTYPVEDIHKKITAMRTLGVPYPEGYEDKAATDMLNQAKEIEGRLSEAGIEVTPEQEIVALISYLQRLGTDIKGNN